MMSSATIEIDPIASEEEVMQYRALHTGSLVALALGAMSIFVPITAASSFGGAMLIAPIPLAGIFVSLWSLSKIRHESDQYTGRSIAQLGLWLSLGFLIIGVGYGGYVYATEVREGYTRTSFNAMKPDELQERNGVLIPPEIAALDGQKIFIKGYIRPDSITGPRGIGEFLLVRDNNQCCFGDVSKIKYYDQILVTMAGDRRVDYKQRVFRVSGTFRIEPQYATPGSAKTVFSLKADYAE
jgi:hypothetical protein